MMNFLKKCAHLYDRINDQPDMEVSLGTTMGVAVTRRSDLSRAGDL
jgi:hypothetical protein